VTTTTVPDLMLAHVESRTLKGDRSYQQDAADWSRAVDPDTGLPVIVAAVADGCGSGSGSGRIARAAVSLAVQIAACYGAEHLDRAIDAAREIIDARFPRRGRNDNSTLVLAYYDAARLRVAWIGDSRAYALAADGQLHQLTKDHNLAPHAPNVLTRALLADGNHRHGDAWEGCESHTPQVADPLLGRPFAPPPARILLCTDGACGPLADEEIASTLASTSDASSAARRLAARAVRTARAAGEKADNATAFVIDLGGVD
jgi:serine/threonine protein phosphatase PrpC